MKCWLISDNADTQMGMRLAGVEGVLVHEHDEVISALDSAVAREDIAVVFVTKKLSDMCGTEISERKLTLRRPLIVEIPDRHGNGRTKDSITKYVKEAIGVDMS